MKIKIFSMATTMALTIGFNGCGESTTSSENNNNEVRIDLAQYLPKSSVTENWVKIVDDSNKTTRDTSHYVEKIVRKDNLISYELDNKVRRTIEIGKEDINISDTNSSDSIETRHVALGGIISSSFSSVSRTINGGISRKVETTQKCIVEKRVDTFLADTALDIRYEGDLVRQKCTRIKEEIFSSDANKTYITRDISYSYAKKDKGLVAFINRNCFVKDLAYTSATGSLYRLDDNSQTCNIVVVKKNLLSE